MMIGFSSQVWYLPEQEPFYFLSIPIEESRRINEIRSLTVRSSPNVAVVASIGDTQFHALLWWKDGSYLLPLDPIIRKAEGILEGDHISSKIEIVSSPDS